MRALGLDQLDLKLRHGAHLRTAYPPNVRATSGVGSEGLGAGDRVGLHRELGRTVGGPSAQK